MLDLLFTIFVSMFMIVIGLKSFDFVLSHILSVYYGQCINTLGMILFFCFNVPEGLYILKIHYLCLESSRKQKTKLGYKLPRPEATLGGNSLTTFLKFLLCLLIYPIFYFLNMFIYVFEIFTFISRTFP